jgi:hypothetical protein
MNMNDNTTNPPQTQEESRIGVFNNASHSERLVIAYKILQPIFDEGINRILDAYGLATRLQEAKQAGQKLRILQVNCVEGLFLHELARVLEERDLLEGADLYGISADQAQINTAEGYSRLATPPRPYLNFYLCDWHQPLENCLGLHVDLKVSAPATFDFIFAAQETLKITRNAHSVLQRLYRDNLNPNGLMLFNENKTREDPVEGWVSPHPAFTELIMPASLAVRTYNPAFTELIMPASLAVRTYNPGVPEVGLAAMEWLKEVGAIEYLQYKTKIPLGGYTELGRNMLRNSILFFNISKPLYIASGWMSAEHFDSLLATLYREISPQHEGCNCYFTTIGRKPA